MAEDLNLQLLRAQLPGLHRDAQGGDVSARRELVRVIELIERMEARTRGSHLDTPAAAIEPAEGELGRGVTEVSALVDRFKVEPGGWLAAADHELARLVTLEHYHKRRNTVVALVDARLACRPEEDVWRRPDTCSRNTYHEKWKKQGLFVEVLARVEEIARTWTDSEELQALRSASRRLALASPAAASKAVEQLEAEDGNLVLRAAFGILDRAGKETASKSSVQVDVTADDLAAAREEARRYREERGLGAGEWGLGAGGLDTAGGTGLLDQPGLLDQAGLLDQRGGE